MIDRPPVFVTKSAIIKKLKRETRFAEFNPPREVIGLGMRKMKVLSATVEIPGKSRTADEFKIADWDGNIFFLNVASAIAPKQAGAVEETQLFLKENYKQLRQIFREIGQEIADA